MSASVDLVGIYLHLARASEMRRRPHARDRFLVLAGSLAAETRLPHVAACCRRKVLQHNPAHMVRRWETMEQAVEDDDYQHFRRQLQRRYPRERSERMLAALGIETARERQSYFSDEEYALALLGAGPAERSRLMDDSDDPPSEG